MCRKLFALTALALAFVLIAPLTASADVAVQDGLPQLEMEEPILTPADQPLNLGELDLEKLLREEKIRICDAFPGEPDFPCPDPTCTCVVIRDETRCFC